LSTKRVPYVAAGLLILAGLVVALYGCTITCPFSNTSCPDYAVIYDGWGFTLAAIGIMIMIVSLMAHLDGPLRPAICTSYSPTGSNPILGANPSRAILSKLRMNSVRLTERGIGYSILVWFGCLE
jgi:hypothetical protein